MIWISNLNTGKNTVKAMRLWYPFKVELDDDDKFNLVVRDFPQVHDWGDSKEEVEARAVGAVEAGIAGAIKVRVQVPLPSPQEDGDDDVAILPTLTAMKVLLWNAMLDRGHNKSGLAKLLKVQPNQVDRMFDIDHRTSVEQLERAAHVLLMTWDVGLLDRTTSGRISQSELDYDPSQLLRALAFTALNNDPDRELRQYFWRALTEWNSTHAQKAVSPLISESYGTYSAKNDREGVS